MKPVPATPENTQAAAQLLREEKLVAFPTETVYGLGARADSDTALTSIYRVKGRPKNNPLILHFNQFEMFADWVDLSDPTISDRLGRVQQFWPGPFTAILPAAPHVSKVITAGLDSVAVRIPDHPVARTLIEASGVPLAAPSANRSGYVSPTRAQDVMELGNDVALILDGGDCSVGIESTVLSLIGPHPQLLRPGRITLEQLSECLGKIEHAGQTTEHPASPGVVGKHYQPHTPLKFRDDVRDEALPARVGLIRFSDSEHVEIPSIVVDRCLSADGNSEEVASRLYASLRELDQMDLELILVDSCTTDGVGRAIMDRLSRAVKQE